MMLSREAITAAVEAHIEASDFYKPAHGVDLRGRARAARRGEPVDPVTVAEELRRSGQLDALGGSPTLLRIQAATPASANSAHYAQIVARARRCCGGSSGPRATSRRWRTPSDDDVDETLDRAESLIFEVAERRVADTLMPLHPALEQTMVQLERSTTATRRSSACPPATTTSTSCCSGCSRRRSRSSPARPGQGKTSFALGAALHCRARRQQAGAVLLDGDGPPRAHEAAARGRGADRRAQALDRPALRARVAEAQPGGRPARRSAVLHRRQPALHGDGDARQGAAHEGALRRPRVDRRRLPPAHDDAREARREPPGRGVGAVARVEDPRPRARRAGDDAVAAQPSARVPPGQAADARRPARVGLPRPPTTEITLADGTTATIGELFDAGARDVDVLTLDEHLRLGRA